MKRINQDIKEQSYARVYLLYGDEPYLRRQGRDKLRDSLVPKDDHLNYHYFEGEKVSFPEIIDLAETMPFLNDYKVIVIENSGACKKASDQMAEYLPGIPDTTVIIFVEKEADKRTKLFKAIDKHGKCLEFNKLDQKTLITWIAMQAKGMCKRIHQDAVALLIERTGMEMDAIANELEKVFGYTFGRDDIVKQDIETIVHVRSENKVFEMTHKISQHDQTGALSLYYELLETKEGASGVLTLITRQFNILYQVKSLQQKRYNKDIIAGKLKMKPYHAEQNMREANNFTLEQLQDNLEECVETDRMMKSGMIDGTIGVEILIIKFSTKQ